MQVRTLGSPSTVIWQEAQLPMAQKKPHGAVEVLAFGKDLDPRRVERGRDGFALKARHRPAVEGEVEFLPAVKAQNRVLGNPHVRIAFFL